MCIIFFLLGMQCVCGVVLVYDMLFYFGVWCYVFVCCACVWGFLCVLFFYFWSAVCVLGLCVLCYFFILVCYFMLVCVNISISKYMFPPYKLKTQKNYKTQKYLFLKIIKSLSKNIKNYVSLDSSFRGTYGGEHIPSG